MQEILEDFPMPFTKGHTINLGRKMPDKERLKHSMFGNKNPQYGKDPWNKNKKCKQLAGEKNGCWKGDLASYSAKHIWMKINFGKADKCEGSYCSGESKTFHWANISGEYKRKRSDWKMLCVKCHKRFDRSIDE